MIENDSEAGAASEKSEGDRSADRLPVLILPHLELPELFPQDMLERVARIGTALRQFGEQITETITSIGAVFKALNEDIRRAERIEASGWLPHYTTPFDLIDDAASTDTIDEIIGACYRERWNETEQAFRRRLSGYDIDDEAKEAFSEALMAHGHGLYRLVPRTLFPEIERVARLTFYDGSTIPGTAGSQDKKADLSSIASLPGFAETVGELPIGHVLTTDYGIALYLKLEGHLYRRVKLPDEIEKARADAVPNRHASLHGIVVYNTAKSSLNALIMTDFILHLISQIKSLRQDDDGENA